MVKEPRRLRPRQLRFAGVRSRGEALLSPSKPKPVSALIISALLFSISLFTNASLAGEQQVQTLSIVIEANESDKALLMDRLNEHGRGRGLHFEATQKDYAYRIEYATGMTTGTWVANGTGGTSEGSRGIGYRLRRQGSGAVPCAASSKMVGEGSDQRNCKGNRKANREFPVACGAIDPR